MARLPVVGQDDGTWGDILNGYLSQVHTASGQLKADSVGTTQIKDNAVTSAQLADNSVNSSTIQDGSITEAQLDSNVQTKLNQSSDPSDGSVTTAKLADGAVTDAKVAAGAAISADKLADGTTNKVYTAAEQTKLAGLSSIRCFQGLKAALQDGDESVCWALLGDSTGNGSDEWFYQCAEQTAPYYPNYTVQVRTWDDATSRYLAPATVQTGPSGQRAMKIADSSGAGAYWTAAQPTGDIDVAVWCKPTSWTSGAIQTFVSRYGNPGSRAFTFRINSTGLLILDWTTDGSTNQSSPFSTAAVPFSAGSAGWVRAQLDIDNGSGQHTIKYFTSANGTTWTQLGSTITRSGTTSVFASTYRYEIGSRGGAVEPANGARFYEVYVRNGIDGPTLTPVMADAWATAYVTPAPTIEGSPVLTMLNGSHPGANITYHTDSVRFPKLNPDFGHAVIGLSCSHNQLGAVGTEWITALSGWATSVRQRFPYASLLILTQNPRKSPANLLLEHGIRRRQAISWGNSNSTDVIDIYGHFLAYPGGYEQLVAADGIHPTAGSSAGTGSRVWADAVMAELLASQS